MVKEYLENRYRYSKEDLLNLIEPQRKRHKEINPSVQAKLDSAGNNFKEDRIVDLDLVEPLCKKPVIASKTAKCNKKKINNSVKNTEAKTLSDDDFEEEKSKEFETSSQRNLEPNQSHSTRKKSSKDKPKHDMEDMDIEYIPETPNLTYKLRNNSEEYPIMEVDDKKICPFCQASVKNIKLHFDRNQTCGEKVDIQHFSQLHKTMMHEKRKKQVRIAVQKRKDLLKATNREKFDEDNRKASAKSKQKSRNQNPEKFGEDHRNASGKYWEKKKANTDETDRLRRFNMKIMFGPIFICSCCKRKLFENGVTKITMDFKQAVNKKNPYFYRNCIPKEEEVKINFNGSGVKSGAYICQTCKTAMNAGKMPSMSIKNGLHLANIEENCKLTELENNLIAQNINFQYIFYLKKSRWAATKKQMISVPVTVDKVLNTINQLPRLPRDAGLIPIKLKRKKIYDRAHKSEYINPLKIFKVLHNLKKSGHPYYQFYDDFKTFKDRCQLEDEEGHSLLFSNEDNLSQEKNVQNIDIDESAESETDEDNIRIKDPIRKHQFDHNNNTCLTNNFPEMCVDGNGEKLTSDQLEFAPAEGNHPINLLQEKDWDIKSWPALHPDGQFGIHHKRKARLTDQQYFEQRLLNKDPRFSTSPGYIFAAAAYIEQKQLSSKANISFMRGKKTLNGEGINQYELDDAFTTFEGVKNTPKYWQKVKYEMIAKLENLGPFQMFFTLSCGDSRYDENFSTFLVENGYTMEYYLKPDATTETIVKSKDKRHIEKALKKFLDEDIDESLHEMIRTNVLTATRNFQHRVDAFRTEIILGENNPMKVKHISYRVEFQGRGAAHIHGTLWLDIKEIENSLAFCERSNGDESKCLFEAFRKLRDNVKLTVNEKDAVATLTDMFITCSLNSDTVHDNKIIAKRIIEIVKAVNCHHCTGPCSKTYDKCKYGFPRYPLKQTLVVDRNEFEKEGNLENLENKQEEEKLNYNQILSDVEEILKDEEMVKIIMDTYPKGKTEVEYTENRGKRIDLMLEIAGGIRYEDYILAIKKTRKHGCAVLLKRDVDEIYVNNYNPEWINAWNANVDLQPVLDFFAVITYVTDYWAKPDEGITQTLREAASILKSEPNQQKRCQQMANTFLTHRQMSEAEAYYKILPHLKLKYSNIATIFIPTDKKELRSKFLAKLDEGDSNFDKGSKVMGGKEGIYLEKPDIVDKFCRRVITEKNEELGHLRMIHFAKMYQPITAKRAKEDNKANLKTIEDTISNNNKPWDDEEDKIANFYVTGNPKYDRIPLPKFIKLKDCSPGEVTLMEKRSFPKAARMHKKREDNDPHRFFLSELMLYSSYTNENQLGCDDEEKCKNLYLKDKENIQYIKSIMMPFTQGVEEARHYVQQAMEDNPQKSNTIGDELDVEMEKEIQECEDFVGNDDHPDFIHLNPDEFEVDSNIAQVRKSFREIEIRTADEILREARGLDEYQKKGLNIIVDYIQDILISRKGKLPFPAAPLLIVNGGAGSGKSTLISAISQYAHYTLRRDGDDPNCPNVLLGAYTGGAASNIKGQTLHSLFSFNFGAGYLSLSDKQRDEKRIMYKNLKLLIIDEISLVDADMFYKIDLRLREIMQKPVPFGNIALIVLGDIMQMSPISGRYIFLNPLNSQFHLTHDLDPLWKKFKCLTLEINHRQGEDREYAEILNRIRVGQETDNDIEILEKRVRKEKAREVVQEMNVLYIYGTNAKVNQMNCRRLKLIKGQERIIRATCLHKTIKKFDPPEGKAGEVNKTPFQKELKIKVGAKVMLTYNVDTSDGLTNGAFGELAGIMEDSKGNITKLVVKFDQQTIGKEKRRLNPEISRRYPDGTIIEKVNFPFSISKSKTSIVNTANVIQFPIRLAFACTAHKVQGATIPKPKKLIINVTDAFAAAMIYVMLSRVCSLDQILILNEFDKSKMYPNKKALEELKRLEEISMNKNLTKWEQPIDGELRIGSLNCRSLRKHHGDIITDKDLLICDMICLQETWLESDDQIEDLEIPGYTIHMNSRGKGKGIAIYFKPEYFKHEFDIKRDHMQLSKFSSSTADIIVLYKSRQESQENLNQAIEIMTQCSGNVLILGDFNYCYNIDSTSAITKYMKERQFKQLIAVPTHIEGSLLDQAYLRDIEKELTVTAEVHGKYYTDHKSLNIILKKVC